MKTLSFLILFLLTPAAYSQLDVKPCNQLPIAAPEKIAVYEGDLLQYLSAAMNSQLKKGTHSAVYKLLVDCHGVVSKVLYQRGTLSETHQKLFADKIGTTKWIPAMDQLANVTTFVFISIEITAGRMTVTVQ